MIAFRDRYRDATIALVDRHGHPLGTLPPVRLDTPWFQEIATLVQAIHSRHDIDITILRLLQVIDDQPPRLEVLYLAELTRGDAAHLPLADWNDALDEQPLRLPYAKLGGPAADLDWAEHALRSNGLGAVQTRRQIRTWNLSSIWQLTTADDIYWLKSVPPFFAHEGDVISLLRDEPVPRLVAQDERRILMHHLPGEDCYDANAAQMEHMIGVLVDLQWRWRNRLLDLRNASVPDGTAGTMPDRIGNTIERNLGLVDAPLRPTLTAFLADLPDRLSRLDECGFPNTLVHGDYHPGNWRGAGLDLTMLDWGDCFIGHPLLDLPALVERAGNAGEQLTTHWKSAWRERLPHADVDAALRLVAPIAEARRAVVFQTFLDNIEPSERIYHDTDPAMHLTRTANLVIGV